MAPTIHASAVLVGARALLIQGPPGSGKSRLVLALLQAADRGALRFVRLVADDRVEVEATHGRLLLRPAPALAGLLEVRGLGIRRLPHEPAAVAAAVVELGQARTDRLPEPAQASIAGVLLPRLSIAAAEAPLPLVLAYLGTTDALAK
jgi:HPr kinase/phosphorylase